jgi:small subunit ribosomal protein S15
MDRKNKKKVIKKHGTHDGDTGSSQVQVAILTHRINELSDHLKSHKKDHEARRGLLGLVTKRRKHLDYLKYRQPEAYKEVTSSLSLKTK